MVNYSNKITYLDKLIFDYQGNINDFFILDNYESYISKQEDINDLQRSALNTLFNDKSISDITERCNAATSIYPLCFEAYYICYYLYDSLSFYYFSLEIINHIYNEYQSDYDLNNLTNIYILLSSFFIDIKNNHKALEMLDEAAVFVDKSILLTKYLIAYSFLENADEMMNLYNNIPFVEAKDYILLILCLLKNNRNDEAKDVFEQMLNTIKYAELLCNPNTIEDIKDDDATKLLYDVDACFELIESVPCFFSFLQEYLETRNKIVN